MSPAPRPSIALSGRIPALAGRIPALAGRIPALAGRMHALAGPMHALAGRIPALAGRILALAGLMLSLAAPAAAQEGGGAGGPVMLPGMGSHRREISTVSKEAQAWFDQGLTLAYAFNHDEAVRSFAEAARLDPQCVMAWWGIALVNGPHINNATMDEARSKAAWDALQEARAARRATPVERALVEALSKRYAWPPPADRGPLDAAYAAAMRRLQAQQPGDADIATLAAEALMDLRPWDLWAAGGKPQPGTEEVLRLLRRALELNPSHPGANHLLIHATEASPHPEDGLDAARRLKTLVPGAGHLVHMPAHVHARTGDWEAAADANLQAIEADAAYRKLSPRQGFYRVYMAHDHQFLAFARMMQGRGKEAHAAALEMVAGIPDDWKKEMAPVIDGYLPLPYETLVRFGRWQEMLDVPRPADEFPITIAAWHQARGVALAALKRTDEARQELAAFERAAKAVPASGVVGNNPASLVLDVARHVLLGEIALGAGDLDEAIAYLRRGAAVEDRLRYNEPPDWTIPVRHPLGAVLLRAGRARDAEEVYRQDLRSWPENGWSLQGLAEALRAQGRDADARAVQRRVDRVWAAADCSRGSSCLCVK